MRCQRPFSNMATKNSAEILDSNLEGFPFDGNLTVGSSDVLEAIQYGDVPNTEWGAMWSIRMGGLLGALGNMVYPRPVSLPYPNTWLRFTVPHPSGAKSLRVQDLTEDMFPAALALLAKYFMQDEPPCKYIEINKHPTAVSELKKLWSTTMDDRLSLACVTDDDEAQLVSVNVLTVAKKEDKDEAFQTDDPVWAALFGAVDLVSKGVDIFSKYGVDRYLTAYGLVVDPAWRGMKIGQKVLEARIPLCKALGLRVTATVFTAAASQCVAKKAGFQDLFEMTYDELAQKGCVFPGVQQDTKSSKLMALVIE